MKEVQTKIEPECDFCDKAGARHEGGAEINGEAISGNFCNQSCFEKWLKWKASLSKLKPIVAVTE